MYKTVAAQQTNMLNTEEKKKYNAKKHSMKGNKDKI
jgi:hypothetical protein